MKIFLVTRIFGNKSVFVLFFLFFAIFWPYDRFSSFIKFWSSERNTISDLYFNEESDYSNENTIDNEDLNSTILQPFQFELEQKKTCDNERHE